MNVKWQLWHDECQKHTFNLEQQINEQQQQINTTSTTTVRSASSIQLVNDLGTVDKYSSRDNGSRTTLDESVHASRRTDCDRVERDIEEVFSIKLTLTHFCRVILLDLCARGFVLEGSSDSFEFGNDIEFCLTSS